MESDTPHTMGMPLEFIQILARIYVPELDGMVMRAARYGIWFCRVDCYCFNRIGVALCEMFSPLRMLTLFICGKASSAGILTSSSTIVIDSNFKI